MRSGAQKGTGRLGIDAIDGEDRPEAEEKNFDSRRFTASRQAFFGEDVEDDDAELFVAAICPGQLRTTVIGGELEARVRCTFVCGKNRANGESEEGRSREARARRAEHRAYLSSSRLRLRGEETAQR